MWNLFPSQEDRAPAFGLWKPVKLFNENGSTCKLYLVNYTMKLAQLVNYNLPLLKIKHLLLPPLRGEEAVDWVMD